MKNVLKSVLIGEFTHFRDLILQFMVVKCISLHFVISELIHSQKG